MQSRQNANKKHEKYCQHNENTGKIGQNGEIGFSAEVVGPINPYNMCNQNFLKMSFKSGTVEAKNTKRKIRCEIRLPHFAE